MSTPSRQERMERLLRSAVVMAQEAALIHHHESRTAARFREIARQVTRALKVAQEKED